MRSGSHNHNEIVVEHPGEGRSGTSAEQKPRDIESVAASEAQPIGCNHNQIGVLNHNHISVHGV
ncbi:hypothetical protein [Streptomyces sp. NPDC001381]|uniref:hypothetical protein n=1 Tax=Streptomyces sp. NPDC001381 TaxID=3364567 RepID=UPI0036AFD945